MIKYILAIIIIVLTIVVHELGHYTGAKLCGLKPKFIITKIKFWGYCPAVKIERVDTINQLRIIFLLPVPFCVFLFSCYGFVLFEELLIAVFIGFILMFVSSYHDFKELRRLGKEIRS